MGNDAMNRTPSGFFKDITDRIRRLEARLPRSPGADVPGAVKMYAGATAPSGWAICDGSVYDPAANPGLFAAIGTTYGGTSGSPLLPNLKGRVAVGRDTGQVEFDTVGETGGAKAHTLTVAEMPSHFHQDPTTTGSAGAYELAGLPPTNPNAGYDYGAQSAPTSSTGGGGAHNNLQPYIVMSYIISLG